MLTERKKNEFKTRDLVQDLGRLVKGPLEPVRDLVSGFEFAPGALGALLSYAELLADENNYEYISSAEFGRILIQRPLAFSFLSLLFQRTSGECTNTIHFLGENAITGRSSRVQGVPPALFSSSFWLTELDNDRDPALTIAGNGSF
ncbi:hypothetical protein NC653_029177 [Populus alba x Populus x berolinensis]|uniref:Uncharacterized protein n=1 Tax=Populus alba x Populus x berolinensis TaxID=444605 RepID=A0AAD6Q4X6_9ROSI|nr:hypothetical protein NC653_029177 [Populus alba x Populus x berolinensis]